MVKVQENIVSFSVQDGIDFELKIKLSLFCCK